MPDQEMIDRVAEGLRQHFKDTVAKSADMPFEETKVTIPAKVIWEEYAIAATKAMREPTNIMHKAMCKSYNSPAAIWIAGIDAILND